MLRSALVAAIAGTVACAFAADPATAPAPRMHFTIGNDVSLHILPLKEAEQQITSIAAAAKQTRVTAFEPYVKWSMLEPTPGKWDFSFYDMQVRTLQKHNLKWVPFLIAGPAYATPRWFKESNESVFAVCLEHNQPTRTQSIWNPALPKHIDRLLEAFARHFDHKQIQTLLLGISGDFGETIFPVSGNEWTYTKCPDPDGNYHTHLGYWCGDKYAIADFQRAMRDQYPSIESLNNAWKTEHNDFDQVKPFIPDKTTTDRARLDLANWYRGSMTRFAEIWLQSARKHLPDVQINLCTGGDMSLRHGSDFSAQAIMAAKYHAGIRITNEASDYANNFVITRWVGSSCRNLHTYFGYEPAGEVTEAGIVARIYNAVASGADELFVYDNPPAGPRAAVYNKYRNLLVKRTPDVPVAVFFSKTSQILGQWNQQYGSAARFRDYSDFDFLDESLIAQGFLERYKALIWIHGPTADKPTLEKIATWQATGGKLFTRIHPRDTDGTDWTQKLHITTPNNEPLEPFFERVATKIPDLLRDGKADKIYHTHFTDGSSLTYNPETSTITQTR